jgi:uncharacterized protein
MSRTRHLTVQCRAEVEGRTLTGHAAVFDRPAEIVPRFWESIDRNAFDAALERDDVIATINHDRAALLGRVSSRTLRLSTDSTGLLFTVDLPDTSYANDLRELVARGDITEASFAFIPGQVTQARHGDDPLIRVGPVARLVDVSAVTTPAYSGTDVGLRAYDFDPPSGRSQLIRARARLLARKG